MMIKNSITIFNFAQNNFTDSLFTFKAKMTSQTVNNGTKDVEIMVPLKYVSNFWRTLKTSLINCEINVLVEAITDTKLYVPVVTLSTQDNSKLL